MEPALAWFLPSLEPKDDTQRDKAPRDGAQRVDGTLARLLPSAILLLQNTRKAKA